MNGNFDDESGSKWRGENKYVSSFDELPTGLNDDELHDAGHEDF